MNENLPSGTSMDTLLAKLPKENPWEALTHKPGTITTMRFPEANTLDIYRGLNQHGEYMFMLKLPEPGKEIRCKTSFPIIDGCRVEYLFFSNHLHCCLILENDEEWRIFFMLCSLLRDALEVHPTHKNTTLVENFIQQLQKCQAFFSQRKNKTLDKSAAQGLYGELRFLRDCVIKNLKADDWLATWDGPLGSKQDFSILDTVIEVKTKTTSSGNAIEISSIDQLCPNNNRGFLCINRISPHIEGISLVDLVKEIKRILPSEGHRENLHILLSYVGYSTADEHTQIYQQKWKLVDRAFYEIRDNFPRITSGDLMLGILPERVRYAVDQNALSDFKSTPEWIKI